MWPCFLTKGGLGGMLIILLVAKALGGLEGFQGSWGGSSGDAIPVGHIADFHNV